MFIMLFPRKDMEESLGNGEEDLPCAILLFPRLERILKIRRVTVPGLKPRDGFPEMTAVYFSLPLFSGFH